MQASYYSERARPLYRLVQVVWYVLGVLEALLAFRFVMRFMGANPAAGFSEFIYGITAPFVAPFQAVFDVTRVEGSVVEWTTLLAMFAYWVLAWALIRLFLMGRPVSEPEANARLDAQDK